MSRAWVAGAVRSTAIARRRLGAAAARRLAASPSLAEALTVLAGTPYGHDVRPDSTLDEAQRAVGATLLWHLRVLAGWVPRDGVDRLRLLAAGFEVANLDGHLDGLQGRPADRPYRLGTLATAWGRLRVTSSATEVRAVLGTSAWGDPGADTPAALRLGVRLSWAARVQAGVPEARGWAAGAAALLVARETLLAGRRLPDALADRAAVVLGTGWRTATTLPELADTLPRDAAWAVPEAGEPRHLWQAEAAWWHRLERDGFSLLRGSGFGPGPLLGSVGVLATDAWRVRAALGMAARGGGPLEAFDAVA